MTHVWFGSIGDYVTAAAFHDPIDWEEGVPLECPEM